MNKIIRLTESDLHRLVKESVQRIIATENIHNILSESGGVYPDGQVDMFFDQDGVDKYRTSANSKATEALLKAEKECGWGHSSSKDVGTYTEYVCYPLSEYTSKGRGLFMDLIKKYAPIKDNIIFMKPRDPFTKVFNVRIKNI